VDNDFTTKSLSSYSRCDLLLVPTRMHEYYYVKYLGNKVKKYDSSDHIIYLKDDSPIIVCTLYTGIKDGIDLRIDRIMVGLMPEQNIPDVIRWFKQWTPAIKNINQKYYDSGMNFVHGLLRDMDQ